MIHIKYLNLFMKTEKIQKNIDLYLDNYNYVTCISHEDPNNNYL